MAKAKVKFRASSVGTKEGTLYYQVIHQRMARQIHTTYRLHPGEWDADRAEIALPDAVGAQRREYLLALRDTVAADMRRLSAVMARLERTGRAYSADDVVALYRDGRAGHGMVAYARELACRLGRIGKARRAEKYTTATNSFQRYLGQRDVPLEEVDGTLMQGYESYLEASGVCRNTVSFYMRNLRAIYNHAVEEGLVASAQPFRHVYTGIDKTVKRAIPIETVRRMKALDLRLSPTLDYARDMFLFSFYTRGMSFIDMAYLRKSDLRHGILCYRRQKTAQQLFIKWERPMQEIIGKYDTRDTPFLLPIVGGGGEDLRRQYKNAYNRLNKLLRQLGEMLQLPMPLTTYVARHAWASIAQSKRIPVATISEALGHDSEKTTRIYLASLDTSVVDRANSLIIRSL